MGLVDQALGRHWAFRLYYAGQKDYIPRLTFSEGGRSPNVS